MKWPLILGCRREHQPEPRDDMANEAVPRARLHAALHPASVLVLEIHEFKDTGVSMGKALILLLLAGCAQTDVNKAWSECLALGGSPKFIVTESIRQAECKR